MFWGLGLLPLSPALSLIAGAARADRAAPACGAPLGLPARRADPGRAGGGRRSADRAEHSGDADARDAGAGARRTIRRSAAPAIALAAPPRPARSHAARRLEPRARRLRPGERRPGRRSRRSRHDKTREIYLPRHGTADRDRAARRASAPGCPAGDTRTTRDWDMNQGGDQVGVVALRGLSLRQLALRRIGRRARRPRLRRVDVRAAATTRPSRARRAPSWRCRPAAWCRA